jgi:hypothetical protein
MTPAEAGGRAPARLRLGRCVFDVEARTLFDDYG